MKLGLGLYRHMLTTDNFSIAGVWGHVVGPFARGGAESVGFLIPDHTPQMTCAAPWHAGMAYALGYMRAAFTLIGVD